MDGEPQGASGRGERGEIRDPEEERERRKSGKNEDKAGREAGCKTQRGNTLGGVSSSSGLDSGLDCVCVCVSVC